MPQLTIAMTDPDAPSRDDPEWSEICHWIATDVPLTKPDEEEDEDGDVAQLSKGLSDVMPFKPPGPPPKTGKHRYVFVALVPRNGTTESLHLSKPGDRQHWGYEHERDGLKMWAEEMGLQVIGKCSFLSRFGSVGSLWKVLNAMLGLLLTRLTGANFIYAQNDKQ